MSCFTNLWNPKKKTRMYSQTETDSQTQTDGYPRGSWGGINQGLGLTETHYC